MIQDKIINQSTNDIKHVLNENKRFSKKNHQNSIKLPKRILDDEGNPIFRLENQGFDSTKQPDRKAINNSQTTQKIQETNASEAYSPLVLEKLKKTALKHIDYKSKLNKSMHSERI